MSFERFETHISSLLVAGDEVFKFKKPVKLPFVDFSTPVLRRHFCEEELRLNRRTAPQLYRGVVTLGGEPALWMRRFDNAGLFDVLAREGRLTAGHIDALALEIARFQATLAPSPPGFDAAEVATRWAADNLRELQAMGAALTGADAAAHPPPPTPPTQPTHPAPPAQPARPAQPAGWASPEDLADLVEWNAARAEALAPLLRARQAAGAVVEGHGDLHLGNIVWHEGRPLLFDALEFNAELRHADRLADPAFTFMDLLDHGLPALAWRLMSQWLEAGGDWDALPMLRWCAAYRALVRAKVALLQQRPADAVRRIALARTLAVAAPAPTLVLTTGLSGSGKSTVALGLVGTLGAVRVRSDVERKRLHGLAATARVADPALLYNPETTRRTYARLGEIARGGLAGGVNVILDAAFLRREEREAMRRLAAEAGAGFRILECVAPEAVLAERIRRRQALQHDASDADLAVLALQQRVREPLAPEEGAERVDTTA